MTQMAAMRIIRRQRLQDLERLNSVVLRFMVRVNTRTLRQLTQLPAALLQMQMKYDHSLTGARRSHKNIFGQSNCSCTARADNESHAV